MRNSLLMLTALALVLALAFLVWFTQRDPASDPIERAPAERSAPARSAEAVLSDDSTRDARRADLVVPRPDASAPVSTAAGIGTLHVRVHFADGSSSSPGRVSVKVQSGLGEAPIVGTPDPDQYLATGLAFGAWHVTATASGCRSERARVELTPLERDKSVDLVLAKSEVIRVRWTSADGEPIAKALETAGLSSGSCDLLVTLTELAPRQDGPLVQAAAIDWVGHKFMLDRPETAGGIEIADLGATAAGPRPPDPYPAPDTFGLLCADRPAPLHAGAWVSGILVGVQRIVVGQREVTFTTPLHDIARFEGRLSACVVDDATGLPVRGAVLQLSCWGQSLQKYTTDDEGCASGLPCQPVRADVVAQAPGYVDARSSVSVLSGSPTDLGQIRLTRPCSIRARVVDGDGRGVPDVTIILSSLAYYEATRVAPFAHVLNTDANGDIAFESVSRERFVLRASGRLSSVPMLVDARSGSVDGLVVRVAPAVVVGLDFVELPLHGTSALVETRDGLPVTASQVHDEGVWALSAAPGSYVLFLVEDGRASEKVDLLVGEQPFVFEISR